MSGPFISFAYQFLAALKRCRNSLDRKFPSAAYFHPANFCEPPDSQFYTSRPFAWQPEFEFWRESHLQVKWSHKVTNAPPQEMYNVFALPVKAYQNVCRFISDGRSWLQEERKEGASTLQAIFGHTLHPVCRSFQPSLSSKNFKCVYSGVRLVCASPSH